MKNTYTVDGNIVYIDIIHKNKIYKCIIDLEDLDKVAFIKGTWHLNVNRNGHIDGVRTKIQKDKIRKQFWMHNIIREHSADKVVDHINHNTLDNRKENLRIITAQENSTNISINKKSTTGVRNIYFEKGRYSVRINNKRFGSYKHFRRSKSNSFSKKKRNISIITLTRK